MKSLRVVSAIAVLAAASLAPLPAQTLGGCAMFPANNIWNTPIDTLPVSANSAAYINSIGASPGLHPDFGSGTWDGAPIGIPYIAGAPAVRRKWPSRSTTPTRATPGRTRSHQSAHRRRLDSTGDRHMLIVDSTNCLLYELYAAYPQTRRHLAGGLGRDFRFEGNQLRPAGWTSADAAGLPILPGLVRYDEVPRARSSTPSASRPDTQKAYVWPARHYASSNTSTSVPPMGQRFRLKSDFDVSGYPSTCR